MADTIQADYQQLNDIVTKFYNQASAVYDIWNKLKSASDPLKDGGWIGKGSTRFSRKWMKRSCLPRRGWSQR